MATTLPAPGPQQPIGDDQARLFVEQIIGSDIDHAWTGDWHHTLQETAARWAPTRRQRLTSHARRVVRAVIYLLHTGVFLAAGYVAYRVTLPYLPHVPVVDLSAAYLAGSLTGIGVGLALDTAVGKLLRAVNAAPAPNTPEGHH